MPCVLTEEREACRLAHQLNAFVDKQLSWDWLAASINASHEAGTIA
jgi:hypothetical protein